MALGRKSAQSGAPSDQEETTVTNGEIVVPEFRLPEGTQMPTLPGESFTELAGELVGMTNSRELLKVKHDLIGVPMILTSFTFRYGAKGKGEAFGDYVSVEAVTFDNRRVVFNDSSTGVRLQVAEWINSSLGGGKINPKEPFQTWDSDLLERVGTWKGEGNKASWTYTALPDGRPIRFLCRHGLRVSEYFHEDSNSDAETFYLD